MILLFNLKPNAATDDDVTALVTAAAAGITESVELLLKVLELIHVKSLHFVHATIAPY